MTAETARKPRHRILILFVLSLGCEAIYLLPYLRWTYYDQMLEAFQFTNTELTTLGSIFGAVAMVCYFFGGPIADRFSPRKLMTISYALSGLGGFWFATYPGYIENVILYVLWGITTTLFMWNAMLRATRTLGSSEEQGRLFGFLEGIRGVFATAMSFLLVAVFAALGSSIAGLTGVIVTISILCIVSAVLAWFLLSDEVTQGDESEKMRWRDIPTVLKNPAIWVLAIVIMSCYSMFSGLTYLTPYATDILGISASAGAVIAVFRMYVCKIAGGPVGGFIADKISVAKTLLIGFVLATVAVLALLVMPASTPVALVVAVIMVFAFSIMAMRGIYYATVDQVNIPVALTGTAMGIVSVIGFLPDVYFNAITGPILDAFPGIAGYQYIFAVMIGFGLLGIVFTVILMKIIKNNQKRKAAVAESGEQAK